MPCSVRLLAGTGNGLAAIQRFQPAHDPRRIFGERGVTARQMLHRHRAVLAVIDRRQQSGTQQLGQLARIDARRSCCPPSAARSCADCTPPAWLPAAPADRTATRNAYLLRRSHARSARLAAGTLCSPAHVEVLECDCSRTGHVMARRSNCSWSLCEGAWLFRHTCENRCRPWNSRKTICCHDGRTRSIPALSAGYRLIRY